MLTFPHLADANLTPEQNSRIQAHVADLHAQATAGSINWLQFAQGVLTVVLQVLQNLPQPPA